MSSVEQTAETLSGIEALMLEKFSTEPFHNFRVLYGGQVPAFLLGGTCSDKTLSFCELARQRGFDVSLHSGYIDGEEKHRLARAVVDGRVFFADVGNGWPALRLYPADREVAFRCFGVGFRTEVVGSRLTVFCERQGRETLQLEVDNVAKPEPTIRTAIEQRFTSGIVYPFSNSLRFSLVIKNRFIFLRGERLEIYGEDFFEVVNGIGLAELPRVLLDYFGYDLRLEAWSRR